MIKKDVMKYLSENANKALAEILSCSTALISMWGDGDLIPAYRAMELDVFFRNKDNRIKYNLSDDHPVFNMHDYVDDKGKVKAFRLKVKGESPTRTKSYKEEGLSNAATKILARADKATSNFRRITILTRFIKGLI